MLKKIATIIILYCAQPACSMQRPANTSNIESPQQEYCYSLLFGKMIPKQQKTTTTPNPSEQKIRDLKLQLSYKKRLFTGYQLYCKMIWQQQLQPYYDNDTALKNLNFLAEPQLIFLANLHADIEDISLKIHELNNHPLNY